MQYRQMQMQTQCTRKHVIECAVAGISFGGGQHIAYNLRDAVNSGKTAWVELRRKSDNAHDPNAIEVVAHATPRPHGHVGYIPAELAKQLAPIIDSGGYVRVTAFEFVGGYGRFNIGMRLKIEVYA